MAEPRVPTRVEIARVTDGRDVTRGYVDGQWWLQPQDRVLLDRGQSDYLLYEDLKRDDRVWTSLLQRRAAVLSRETQIMPGGDGLHDLAAADQLEEILKGLPWNSITDQLLYGALYGWAVAEVMWGRDGRHVVPLEIKPRDRRRFVWRAEKMGASRMRWRLLLRTVEDSVGEPVPDRKFWTMSIGADHVDEPYGLGLGHALYWPVWFKRHQVEFWLVALEKWGQPTGLGKHPPGATESEKKALLQAAKSLHADTAVVIPSTVELEVLEAARSGAVDYAAFYEAMDRAISTVILTETMTTEDGSSRSQAEVHLEVRREVIELDTWMIHDSLRRQVAKWIVDWNFPQGTAVPIVTRVKEKEPDLHVQAQRDKLIVEISGKLLTDKYIEETYGVELGEERMPALMPPGGAPGGDSGEEDDGAEADMAGWQNRALSRELAATRPGLDDLEQVMAAIEDDAWDEMAAPIIEPVLRRARNDPEALLSDLASVWPEMNVSELAERLARVLFVASIWGRLDAEGRRGEEAQ